MTEYHDHRDDCPFKFATLDVCDCVEKNMLDRIEALLAKVKLMDDLDAINGEKIEALIAERDEANKRGDAWRFRADIAEVKLAKAVEALQWCSGSADFNEGGVAREGWLKVCAPLLKGESHE